MQDFVHEPYLLSRAALPLAMWEFPKIGGTLFWRPYNKDPTIWGTILGSPIFGNSHVWQVTTTCHVNSAGTVCV